MQENTEVKVPLTSHDTTAERLTQLRELFPDAFDEGVLDAEKLKQLVGQIAPAGLERYGLSWAGKAEALRAVQTLSTGTLRPVPDQSVAFDMTGNLIIEGDNLEVLKLLQKSYHRSVKMIYIDPPYNTGNEFIYPDNFREGLQTYLEYTGQVKNGVRQTTNAETNGRYHSKWLSMMYPRLFLARNLLHEDGVIFISIDDHEVHNLRLLMNEVFGEENFVASLVWKARLNKDNRNITGVSIDHEYVICYGKRLRGDERNINQYTNPDNDPKGPWTSANMVGLQPEHKRPNLHYDLTNPETGIVYPKPDMGWRYDQQTMARLIGERKILWPLNADGRPRRKKYFSELKTSHTGFSSIIGEEVFTRDGTAEIVELFGDKVFDFPKPSSLIRDLVEQSTGEDDIILDFFAGSGATAQAVMKLNQEDGGNRKFILVQLPETTGRADFSTISEITKQRVRLAAQKLSKSEEGRLPDSEATLQDRGFKAFSLAESNFKVWDADVVNSDGDKLAKQLQLYAEHRLPNRSTQDVLYELLLKSGRSLTAPIVEREIVGQTVYDADGGQLLICLEDSISEDTMHGMIEVKPERVLCLDAAFNGNDQLKTNIVLQMRDAEIEFRTV